MDEGRAWEPTLAGGARHTKISTQQAEARSKRKQAQAIASKQQQASKSKQQKSSSGNKQATTSKHKQTQESACQARTSKRKASNSQQAQASKTQQATTSKRRHAQASESERMQAKEREQRQASTTSKQRHERGNKAEASKKSLRPLGTMGPEEPLFTWILTALPLVFWLKKKYKLRGVVLHFAVALRLVDQVAIVVLLVVGLLGLQVGAHQVVFAVVVVLLLILLWVVRCRQKCLAAHPVVDNCL